MAERLLTTGGLAEAIGIPVVRVRRVLRRGTIHPAVVVGRGWRLFTDEQLEVVKAECERAGRVGRPPKTNMEALSHE